MRARSSSNAQTDFRLRPNRYPGEWRSHTDLPGSILGQVRASFANSTHRNPYTFIDLPSVVCLLEAINYATATMSNQILGERRIKKHIHRPATEATALIDALHPRGQRGTLGAVLVVVHSLAELREGHGRLSSHPWRYTRA